MIGDIWGVNYMPEQISPYPRGGTNNVEMRFENVEILNMYGITKYFPSPRERGRGEGYSE